MSYVVSYELPEEWPTGSNGGVIGVYPLSLIATL
jgi:hypothetical protein